MKFNLIKNKPILLITLSAIITAVAFTFESLSLLMWIGFIPMIYVFITYVDTYKKGLLFSYTYGFIYCLIIFHWIFNLYPLDWVDISKGESIVILFCGWIFVAFVESTIIALIIAMFEFVKLKNNILNVISFGSLWGIIEWVQELGVLAFPWGRIAVSQANNLILVQSASLLGSLFVGFIIIIVNGFLALFIINKFKIKYLIIAVLIFSTNSIYGFYKLNNREQSKDINISIIQGNILTAQKWISGSLQEHLKIYMDLSEEAIKDSLFKGKKTEIIFWPETAIPINLLKSRQVLDKYCKLAEDNNISLITGAYYSEVKDKEVDYNSVYYINKNGEVEDVYFKRHLVPFGEVLPYSELVYNVIPVLKEANLFNNELGYGREANIFETDFGKIGSIICFESLFSKLIIDNLKNGAELLFIATNDSWFKASKAVYQHNNIAILRAIEANRYVVRAANTGVSSVISNYGEIINKSKPLQRVYINSSIKFIHENNIFYNVGYLFTVVQIIYICIILLKKFFRKLLK